MRHFTIIAIIFILSILSKISIAQHTYTWTGNFDGTTYTEMGNWFSSTGTSYPGTGDIAIFNTSADISFIPNNTSTSQLGRIEIINDADVVFSFIDPSPFFAVDSFLVETNSYFSIQQAYSAIFQIEIEANINGNIYFDVGSHKLLAGINGHIYFNDGGSFETGTSFSGYPFGESATQINTVTFRNNSYYYQRNGNTPFGPEGMGGYITTFEPESTFEITWGNGSLISLTGKTYGHITNSSGMDISISATAASTNKTLTFSSITSFDGKIEYFGNEDESIVITGDGINAMNGDIRLQTGIDGITFTATDSYISGFYTVDIIINSSNDVSFNIINAGNTLTLENDVNFLGIGSATSFNSSIYGIIDCGEYVINPGNVIFTLEDESTMITANIDGVQTSIPNVIFNSGTNFTFNGNDAQSSGFSSFPTVNINNLTIDLLSIVTMDNDITINGNAELMSGIFDIANNTLTMSGNIHLYGGTLAGDLNSSILIIDGMPTEELYIPTPLELNTLIINRQIPAVRLYGGTTLLVQNLFDFQMGEFQIDDGELILNGELQLSTGVIFNGGTQAKLTIGSSATFISPLTELELGTFTNVSPLNINMGGNLTLYDLLDLQDGVLTTNQNTLNIHGDCQSAGGTITSDYLTTINIESSISPITLTLTPAENTIGTLMINTAGNVFLPNGATIENMLTIQAGILSIDASNLVFSDIATIDVIGLDSYIATEGEGYVTIPIAVGSTPTIPIGSSLHKTNLIFNNITTADTYDIRVFNDVYSDGYSGTTLTYDDIVNLTWEILPTNTTSLDITLQWQNTANSLNFRLDSCYLSNFDGVEWDQPIPVQGTLLGAYSEISRNNVTNFGLFHVSSHYAEPPSSVDFTVITAKNHDFFFNPQDFPLESLSGDTLTRIQIITPVTSGNLYIDANQDHTIQSGEIVNIDDIINYRDLFFLRFKPIQGETGDAAYNFYYTEFGFVVGTGTEFSLPYNLCTINVTDNNNPYADEQEFYVNENDVSGTLIGNIIVTDPDTEQTLLMKVISGDTLAFKITPKGDITINNPDLIAYSLNPEFVFEIVVRDNGIPNLFYTFIVRILVEEPVNTTMEIANLLTPNGDGYNDFWIINGAPEVTQNFETFIFNNAGKIVFQSQSYYNNWDGTSNGERLLPGVYYYLLRSETEEIKGTITLIR